MVHAAKSLFLEMPVTHPDLSLSNLPWLQSQTRSSSGPFWPEWVKAVAQSCQEKELEAHFGHSSCKTPSKSAQSHRWLSFLFNFSIKTPSGKTSSSTSSLCPPFIVSAAEERANCSQLCRSLQGEPNPLQPAPGGPFPSVSPCSTTNLASAGGPRCCPFLNAQVSLWCPPHP